LYARLFSRSILAILVLQAGCAYQWQGKTYYTKSGAIEAQRQSLAAWLDGVEADQEPSLARLAVVVPSDNEIRKEPVRALIVDSWNVGLEALVEGLRRRNVFQTVELAREEIEPTGDEAPGFVLRAVLVKTGFQWLLESPNGSGVWVVSGTIAVDDVERFGVLLATVESLAKAGSPAKSHPALQRIVRAEAEEPGSGETAQETELILAMDVGSGGASGSVVGAEKDLLNGAGLYGHPVESPVVFGGHLELVPWHIGAWSLGFRAGYSVAHAKESTGYTDGGYSESYRAEFMSFHSVQGGAVLRRAVVGQLHAQLTAEAVVALDGKITAGGLAAGFAGDTPASASFNGYGGRVSLGVVAISEPFPFVFGGELNYDYLRIKTDSRIYPDVPRVSTLKGLGFRAVFGWRF
jgi:hypothetical protein